MEENKLKKSDWVKDIRAKQIEICKRHKLTPACLLGEFRLYTLSSEEMYRYSKQIDEALEGKGELYM